MDPALFMSLLIVMLSVGLCLSFKLFYRKVGSNQALIVRSIGNSTPKVHFFGAFIIPVLHRASVMPISVVAIDMHRRGKDALIFRDGMHVDISMVFYLRVNTNVEAVLRVMKTIGIEHASDHERVKERFEVTLRDALTAVSERIDFKTLHDGRYDFRNRLHDELEQALEGYALEDIVIDYLVPSPPPG